MPLRGKAASFFDKIGSGVVKTGKEIGKSAVKTFSSGAGKMLGQAALEAAPLLLLRTGGRVPGKKGKPLKIIAHGQEYVLPAGVKPTASQKKAVAKNKQKDKMTQRMISGRLK
jgi:hypothetical protein